MLRINSLGSSKDFLRAGGGIMDTRRKSATKSSLRILMWTLTLLLIFLSLTSAKPIERNRQKRQSDQRIAELETLLALHKFGQNRIRDGGRGRESAPGLGLIDFEKIGRKKKSTRFSPGEDEIGKRDELDGNDEDDGNMTKNLITEDGRKQIPLINWKFPSWILPLTTTSSQYHHYRQLQQPLQQSHPQKSHSQSSNPIFESSASSNILDSSSSQIDQK